MSIPDTSPLIVGIGGTIAPSSSSERLLRLMLARCAALGAETRAFAGTDLVLPFYGDPAGREAAAPIVDALRRASAVLIVSPSYHGTVPGLLKNALDYAQELADDPAPYLDGRVVGLVAVAAGWQATGSTLAALRTVVHALRGWPTPLGIAVNSARPFLTEAGDVADPALSAQIDLLARQMLTALQPHPA
jgi:FMN reductase